MPFSPPTRAALCLIAVAVAYPWPLANAAEEPACPQTRSSARIRGTPRTKPADNPPLYIRAQELSSVQGDVTEFSGQVEARRDTQRLNADRLIYEKSANKVEAYGDVTLKDATGMSFFTTELHLELDSRVGYTGPSSFRIPSANNARGDAERIDFEGPDHTRLKQVRYTTCAPGRDDWYLRMSELDLDHAEDIGTAHHTTVTFQGVPLFYFPYLDFPISDQRKSGFLAPRIGVSGKLGTELATPYYWNIAPNYDDTFTPRLMSFRGLQVQNEFRYLTRHSEGQAEFEYLPNDNRANGDNRFAGIYKHKEVFSPLWTGNIDMRGVSDKDYLSDFGDNLQITSQTFLPQNAVANYRGSPWNFSVLASEYQTVDKTIPIDARPYARLPQLNLAASPPIEPNRVNYSFDSEAVNFRHEETTKVAGERMSLGPAISLPLSNSYSFLTPKIGVRQISYNLTGATDDTPGTTAGVFSLDSGLFFERDSTWGGKLYNQTLEPRLFYLYVPYKNQDSLPIFDTGLADLNFSSLFRDNRYSGGDRQGDANQAALGVTTRFLDDKDGVERLRASVGRIYYFSNLKVGALTTTTMTTGATTTITTAPVGTTTAAASDIVGEAYALLSGNWHARTNIQWNREDNHVQKYSYYLQYNPAKNRIVNVGRRQSRDELIDQAEVSAEWPIQGRWTLRARSLYSLQDRHNVDSYAGFEYNACCWAVRVLAARRLVADTTYGTTGIQANSIMFEFELIGLAKQGRVPDSPLQQSVFSFPVNRPKPEEPIAP
jgi:LPS-assembly protein